MFSIYLDRSPSHTAKLYNWRGVADQTSDDA